MVRDGLWVKNENERFLSKNRFFSKTMRVGSKSFRGWNKTPKPFRIRWETVAESFSNFEKIDFLWKKTLILISDPIRHSLPNVHFFIKKSIFSKTMRVGSKSFRSWNKTRKPVRIRWETFAESFRNFEKIVFWQKNE